MEEHKIELAKKRFKKIQAQMFGEISSMLRKAKLTPIWELQENNPSFTALASDLEYFLEHLKQFSEIMPEKFTTEEINRAVDYVRLTKDLAVAIDNDDDDSLGAAIAALDEKPYI